LRRHNRTLDGEALDLDFAAFVDREVAGHRGWVKALAGDIPDDLARPDRGVCLLIARILASGSGGGRLDATAGGSL
jgi:hypothetical protein